MPRQPSPENQIKRLKAEVNRHRKRWLDATAEIRVLEADLKNVIANHDEWKRRFDALLALKVQQGEK